MAKRDPLDKLLRMQTRRRMAVHRRFMVQMREMQGVIRRLTTTQRALEQRELAELRTLMKRSADERTKRQIEGILATREIAKIERDQWRSKLNLG